MYKRQTISNEDFFAENNHTPITFLKVRSSWGQNGSTSNLSGYKSVSYTHLEQWNFPFGPYVHRVEESQPVRTAKNKCPVGQAA